MSISSALVKLVAEEPESPALRQASGELRESAKRRLDTLAQADLAAREQAWR
jgi:hypothetical protein